MLQEIAERIKALPLLPNSFHDINVACNQSDASIHDLVRIIEKDPMPLQCIALIASCTPLLESSLIISFKAFIKSLSLFLTLLFINFIS